MEKKSFVLRIDEQMYEALSRWAADDFRSVNGQLEWIINKSLKDANRAVKPAAEKKEESVKKKK